MSNLDTPNKEDELRDKLKNLYNESRRMAMLRTGSPIDHMVDGAMELIELRENPLKEDLKVVCEEDEDLRKKLAMYVAGLAESGDNFMKPEMVSQEVRTAYVDSLFCLVKSRDQRIALEARIDGMEQAKSRVLRRTEIPKDAKNPTRDYVVILGEQIAQFIDDDIATLKQSQKEE